MNPIRHMAAQGWGRGNHLTFLERSTSAPLKNTSRDLVFLPDGVTLSLNALSTLPRSRAASAFASAQDHSPLRLPSSSQAAAIFIILPENCCGICGGLQGEGD